ncbi:MAG: DNA polymerase III subunit delta [Candidatus Neomarinimicrobiota bacterium]
MDDIKHILLNLKAGEINNVYVLKGEDLFLQNFFIEKLSNKLFLDSSCSKELLTPNELSGKEILDKILSSDLFNSKKLIILRDPQQIKGKVSKELISYCDQPIMNHFLVLICDNYLDKSSFFKNLSSEIPFINVSTPFQSQMIKWANFFVKNNEKNISPDVLKEIINICGDSLYNLKNEIDKICLMTEEKNLKIEHINFDSSFSRSRKRWELMSSLGARDLKKTIKLGKSIIDSSETMVSLIFPMAALFQELLFVKMNYGTFIKPSSYIPLSTLLKNNITNYAKNYTVEDIEVAIKELKKIEIRQKTTNTDDESELINFIYNILG